MIHTRHRPAHRLLAAVATLALGCTSAGAAETTAAETARSPNIVLILADDLGYGDVGAFGQKRIQTPNIDRLAAEGMRLTSFYAGSTVCAPSRCVLMTGLHLGHCYIRGNSKDNLRPNDVTVAEVLKKAGYATGGFGKWGLGHEGSSGLPTRQGFDTFFGYLDQHHAHNYYPTFLICDGERVALENVVPSEGQFGQGVASVKKQYSHDLILAGALEFIDSHHDRPFFLYLPVTLPHANNEAGRKGMEIPDLGMYADRDWPEPQKGLAAMITHLDTGVGQVLERLKKHGIDEKTLVFFSSDNGPHAEGGNDSNFFDSNGPLRGIKRDLYEGGIRVPTIARWPGRIPAGSVSDHIGYFGDVMPTFAELAGTDAPYGLDGISFLPTLLGQPQKQRKHEVLYWEFYERGSAQAVRMGRWKGVCKPLGSRNLELYDLSEDVGETKDIAAEHPEIVEKILAIMEEAHVPSPLWQVRGRAARNR